MGVQAIHAAGFGHADLRWPNIIKITRGTFLVIDLELAVPLDSPQHHRKQNVCKHCLAQMARAGIVGTALSHLPLTIPLK